MTRAILNPVKEDSVVVYVIDNTSSMERYRDELHAAFDKLRSEEYQSVPNVRVAGIKHGDRGGESDPHLYNAQRDTLFGFSAPGDVPTEKVRRKVRGNAGTVEWLYPSIMAARMMIADVCPEGDGGNPEWCRNKRIVVLGDGDPGETPFGNAYYSEPKDYKKMPENLLKSVSQAGIRIDTFCVGLCDYYIQLHVYGRSWEFNLYLTAKECREDDDCIGRNGYEVMQELATLTQGTGYACNRKYAQCP